MLTLRCMQRFLPPKITSDLDFLFDNKKRRFFSLRNDAFLFDLIMVTRREKTVDGAEGQYPQSKY